MINSFQPFQGYDPSTAGAAQASQQPQGPQAYSGPYQPAMSAYNTSLDYGSYVPGLNAQNSSQNTLLQALQSLGSGITALADKPTDSFTYNTTSTYSNPYTSTITNPTSVLPVVTQAPAPTPATPTTAPTYAPSGSSATASRPTSAGGSGLNTGGSGFGNQLPSGTFTPVTGQPGTQSAVNNNSSGFAGNYGSALSSGGNFAQSTGTPGTSGYLSGYGQ